MHTNHSYNYHIVYYLLYLYMLRETKKNAEKYVNLSNASESKKYYGKNTITKSEGRDARGRREILFSKDPV